MSDDPVSENCIGAVVDIGGKGTEPDASPGEQEDEAKALGACNDIGGYAEPALLLEIAGDPARFVFCACAEPAEFEVKVPDNASVFVEVKAFGA